MTFYPLEFIGCLQIPDTNVGCGWQGIVPSKAEKMARISVELMTTKLLSTKDIFDRIDPQRVAEELDTVLDTKLQEIVDKVAKAEHPIIWARMPQTVRDELVRKAKDDAPATIKLLMTDVKQNIDQVFDLASMIVAALVRDPGLLNHMFIECGFDELAFIRDFGGYMGFGFGIFQMGLWMLYSAGWMLPTFGFVVGMVSNWIALKMIFEPVEPYRVCGLGCLEIQGRFLKRQREVSSVYARLVASKMLAARNIIPAILEGTRSETFMKLVRQHVTGACDRYERSSNPVTDGVLSAMSVAKGFERVEACKTMATDSVVDSMAETSKHLEKYLDHAMDLETVLREKMSEMRPSDFERLLHPVFEEDEWKLVLMGGVLGIFIGLMQWYVLGG